ncbi:MAG: hypothetical protein F2813_00480 [Actinobacteria bacterium]|uniref:Unannotated protein n=1 Tax=freshwater metagenome TaxID=449393 RepID=A0A6J5YX10_9ZZZZ|nr:hypothetical protein [Actinomycetota bacterium]
MSKRSRYSLILIAALSSLVIVASAQAAPQQVTSWGVDNGDNGRFEVAATNPTTGDGLAVSYYLDGSTRHWVAMPLDSSGAASGAQTTLLSGGEVTRNANPAVKYDPVSGGWVACLGNDDTEEFQCWFLNGDGTVKAGSPFAVSPAYHYRYYPNISVAYSAEAGKWLAVFRDYDNTATYWFDSSGTFTRGLDLITGASDYGGVDLAYSPKSDKFMVVDRRRIGSDTQDGGYVWYLNGDGTLNSGPTRVGAGDVEYKNPVMAYNAVRDEFLVANFTNSGPSDRSLATERYSASNGASSGETLSAITSSTSTFTSFRNRVAIAAPDYGDSYKIVTPLGIGTSDYGNYSLSLDGAGVLVGEPDALIGPNAALGVKQRPRVDFNQATCSYLSTYNAPVGDPTITSWELFSSVIPAADPCQYALTVAKSGAGSGTIAGGGIDCGSTCSSEETAGSEVTLAATASSGSQFDGWSGACSGTGSCTVSMTEARSVTAGFSSTTPPAPPPSNEFVLSRVVANSSTLQSVIAVSSPGTATQYGTFNYSSAARSAKRLTACAGSKKITKAGRYKLTCKLTSAARSARRRGAIRVTLVTTFKPTGGTTRSVTRTVTLKKTSSGVTG